MNACYNRRRVYDRRQELGEHRHARVVFTFEIRTTPGPGPPARPSITQAVGAQYEMCSPVACITVPLSSPRLFLNTLEGSSAAEKDGPNLPSESSTTARQHLGAGDVVRGEWHRDYAGFAPPSQVSLSTDATFLSERRETRYGRVESSATPDGSHNTQHTRSCIARGNDAHERYPATP